MAFIYCNTIDRITWEMNGPGLDPDESTAGVWRIKISDDIKLCNFFSEILNEEEKEKALLLRQEKDRTRFITSRGALKFLLGKKLGVAPQNIQFTAGPNKKPLLQKISDLNIHFNVSHSGQWVLIAIAPSPVGVDVEEIKNTFSYHDIMEINFSKEERAFIQDSLNPDQDFYLLWTRKEALLKATGKGLDDDLVLVPSLDGLHEEKNHLIQSKESWKVNSFLLVDGYAACLACNEKITSIHFLDTPSSFFLQSV